MNIGKPLRVLIVEDSEGDARLLVQELHRHGYAPVYQRVETAAEMTTALAQAPWDVVVSDHNLPQFDSLGALAVLKQHRPDVPFIVVSGALGEDTAVAAMKAGAHDYVLKDQLTRLVPAIERGLREAEQNQARRAAEQSLRESEELFRKLSESSPLGIFLADAAGGCVYVNPRWRAICGLTLRDSMGDGWQRALHPEDQRRVLARWRVCVRENHEFDQEFRLQSPAGGVRWVHARSVTMHNDRGEVTGHVGTLEDVTARKKLQDQFLQAQKMEAIGQLAGGVAHDFNNLLTVINGYAEMLLARQPAADPWRHHVEEISKAGTRAARLTRQLLAFSRKQILEPTVFDVNEAVTDVEKLLRRLIGEDIHLEVRCCRGPTCVKADAGQIGQVILNLAVNARDAIHAKGRGGRLTVQTHILAPGAAGGNGSELVELAITDTGTGMTAETKAHLFEPFFTTKDQGQGTGLGLATCYGIIQQSGGHISVESEWGQGTTFRVQLPRVHEPTQARVRPGVSAELPRGTETVLLVEDELIVSELARTVLSELGYTVLCASSGEEALTVLRCGAERIHLLLTDVVMPGMGGTDLAAVTRAKFPNVKLLYTSGYTEDTMLRHGISESNMAFLPKPYTSRELAHKVREALAAPDREER